MATHLNKCFHSNRHKLKTSLTNSSLRADYRALKYPNMINNIIVVCVFFIKWWQNNKLYCIHSDGTIWLRGIRFFTQNKLRTEWDEWSSPVMVSFLNERFQEFCIFNQISHCDWDAETEVAFGMKWNKFVQTIAEKINLLKFYWEFDDQFLKSRCWALNFLEAFD